MNLLAIDTATEQFSIALASEEGARADTWFFEVDAGLRHSELVMDSIELLMQKAALKPHDLSGIVCMGGPGSFTGLRIGFSLAKGLALSLNIPFAAVPTLDCLAWPFASLPGIIVPALDAKKGAFFCALYRGGKRLVPDMDARPAEIARIIADTQGQDQAILIGPGAVMLHEQLCATDIQPEIQAGNGLQWGNAKTLLTIALETGIIRQGDVYSGAYDYSHGPEYLRKSDAEFNV